MQLLATLMLTLLAAEPVQHVQASTVNLRSGPSVDAPVAARLRIGTACKVRAQLADGWVQAGCDVDGGDTRAGWVRADMLGPDAPTLQGLVARASSTEDPAQRRTFLLRALTLAPSDAALAARAREAFFSAELAQLSRSRASGDVLKPPRTVTLACTELDGKCLGSALTAKGATHVLTELRGKDFLVVTETPRGALNAVLGALEPAPAAARVELQWSSEPSPELRIALGLPPVVKALPIASIALETGEGETHREIRVTPGSPGPRSLALDPGEELDGVRIRVTPSKGAQPEIRLEQQTVVSVQVSDEGPYVTLSGWRDAASPWQSLKSSRGAWIPSAQSAPTPKYSKAELARELARHGQSGWGERLLANDPVLSAGPVTAAIRVRVLVRDGRDWLEVEEVAIQPATGC